MGNRRCYTSWLDDWLTFQSGWSVYVSCVSVVVVLHFDVFLVGFVVVVVVVVVRAGCAVAFNLSIFSAFVTLLSPPPPFLSSAVLSSSSNPANKTHLS